MTLGVHGRSRPYVPGECRGCRGAGQVHRIPCMKEVELTGLKERAGRTMQGCPWAGKKLRAGACESAGREHEIM